MTVGRFVLPFIRHLAFSQGSLPFVVGLRYGEVRHLGQVVHGCRVGLRVGGISGRLYHLLAELVFSLQALNLQFVLAFPFFFFRLSLYILLVKLQLVLLLLGRLLFRISPCVASNLDKLRHAVRREQGRQVVDVPARCVQLHHVRFEILQLLSLLRVRYRLHAEMPHA